MEYLSLLARTYHPKREKEAVLTISDKISARQEEVCYHVVDWNDSAVYHAVLFQVLFSSHID